MSRGRVAAVLSAVAVLIAPPSVSGQPVADPLLFTAHGGTELAARSWPGMPGAPGVLLLHQCDRDRSMYDRLAPMLAEHGLNVLAFDLRGIGENATPSFHRDGAADSGEFWRRAESATPGDVDAALAALRGADGVDSDRIGVMAASCTGREAVRVAVDATTGEAIVAVVFLSTRLDSAQVARLDVRAADLPTFWIAAEGDRRAADAARAGERLATHPRSRAQIYPGRAHGAPLFTEHPDLEAEIAAWLADALR